MPAQTPTVVVTGAGWATGAAIVRRFAAGGYRVAMPPFREGR
jgi:NAD(P)-dependent dehydrogenase (short-subunit alcohol dehydrogenase family)